AGSTPCLLCPALAPRGGRPGHNLPVEPGWGGMGGHVPMTANRLQLATGGMGRHGEGTVYRRHDGRWSGQIRRPDGSRQTVYGRTGEDAGERPAGAGERIGRDSRAPADTVPDLDELRRNQAAIQRLARSERASNVRVFGSVARGESTVASDYDLVVDLDPEVR